MTTAGYERALLQGFTSSISRPGVTAVRGLVARDFPVSEHAAAHRVLSLGREFGAELEPLRFVLTVGLGQRALASSAQGSLSRFELLAVVDDIAMLGSSPPDVLAALSMIGRLIHAGTEPGSPPWYCGDTLTVAGEGFGGWRRFLLARSVPPIATEAGTIEVARVLPVTDFEADAIRAAPDERGGALFIREREQANMPATLARFRNPPRGPTATLRCAKVEFEPAGDTLRVHPSARAWTTSAMRDAALTFDEAGHLLAVELVDDAGPQVLIELGPIERAARRGIARVLMMEQGTLLITMAEKRVRGHEKNPYVAWARLG
ncbi:MAG: hypothetical protein U0271_42625 [Polyangiaceae bacterium]